MRFFFDTIRTALASLRAKKLRSVLSMLGIVIGILNIATLLSVATGVRAEVVGSIEGLGTNLVAVVPGKFAQGGSFNPVSQIGASTLTQTDVETIRRNVPDAENVSMMMLVGGTAKVGEAVHASEFIMAGTPELAATLNMEIASGRFLGQMDEEGRARVAIVGASAAEGFFGTGDALGEHVSLRGEEFEIVGILEAKPSLSTVGPDMNAIVLIPMETGWQITETRQIFRILMQAPDAEGTADMRERVRLALTEAHAGDEDFTVLTQDDLTELVGNVLDVLTVMLAAISAIALLVGGISIMNIMLVSGSERTREIGIRKAVGATRFAIMLQFLVESVLLTALGGFVAVGMFAAGVRIAAPRVPFPLTLDLSVLFLAFGFSALVGGLFGILPAIRASRRDTIEALRYE